jgi:2-hydroxycyclohexanecarboxyl-CoA dehydrogenase
MGRVAVVTGAGSGIGLATSRLLAERGCRVALLDLNAPAAERAASELRAAGTSAVGVAVDVADRKSVDAAFARVRTEVGRVEILVTCAGIDAFTPFSDISLDTWNRVLAVNLTGTFHCIQSAIPDMLAARFGRIVTISSSSAQTGAPGMAHYAASKGGVIALTKTLALEYARNGITVNTIPPGLVVTPMSQGAVARGDLPSLDVLAARTPVGRGGQPEDVAAACAFLCSDEAGYITGQTFGVNGGAVV